MGRDSSVGIATRYGLDGPGIESRWGRDFPHLPRPAAYRVVSLAGRSVGRQTPPTRDKNKLNGTYVYRHKHNYILCSMFTITKAQLHVSAFNVGHLQVVHEELINKLYQHVWEVYSLWVGGCEILFCVGERSVDWGC